MLWAEKIRYGGLRENEVVVWSMDTGLCGGTYHARDNTKGYVRVPASKINGCPFPTVGTILRVNPQEPSTWDALVEEDSQRIFTGRLDYREGKNARTRLPDMRKLDGQSRQPLSEGLLALADVLK